MEHILLEERNIRSFEYETTGRGNAKYPVREDESVHADKLQREYSEAVVDEDVVGHYLRFEGKPGYDLKVESLDSKRDGHIINVREIRVDEDTTKVSALVYVKNARKRWFSKKIEEYSTKRTKKNNPINKDLIESTEHIEKAELGNFFMSSNPPGEDRKWLEAWFRYNVNVGVQNEIDTLLSSLDTLGILHSRETLFFPEVVIMLIKANDDDIKALAKVSEQLMKFEQCQQVASFIAGQGPDMEIWAELINEQVSVAEESDTYVCVIDTGVRREHPLLSQAIRQEHCLSVVDAWGVEDRRGHGTNMAGTTLFGDLTDIVNGNRIDCPYRLASVKLLPNQGDNEKYLWGDYTRQAIYKAEIELPGKNTVYCMAVTASGKDDSNIFGLPSSWSSAMDSLCCETGSHRLIIVSAGNMPLEWRQRADYNFPHDNLIHLPVNNPAHAWNALSIGAYTRKATISDNADVRPIGMPGGLSPISCTSAMWNKKTPVKPDVVMEGGNLAFSQDPLMPIVTHSDLEVVTTSRNFDLNHMLFDTYNGTSPATALASRYAALVMQRYPQYWPETIRGLFIHTARYTDVMHQQFPDNNNLLRSCGYGVPNLSRMLESFNNGVTFVAQGTLTPFQKEKTVKYNQQNEITLPWPQQTLIELGNMKIRLTVTLSYFIEPAPGDFIPTYNKYAYQSAGLQFDLVRIPGINIHWKWGGHKYRQGGSVFKDYLEMPASDLASCNKIMVFPTSGWWRTRKEFNRYNDHIRYSLIVSLEAPEQDVDLMTEIRNTIEVQV